MTENKKEMFDSETVKYAKRMEREADKFNYRLHTGNDNNRERDDFERDYARILYSSSFRRLQGKMQLLGVDHTSFHRNRLTHSLEVAQIARTIASGLKLKSPVVAEACSLAHDIGNPPFGHSGEIVLNNLAKDIGGFEGNAQVIRIFRTLEKKYPDINGLNLTVRTLLGLTKYFFTKDQDSKKYLYTDDFEELNSALKSKSVNNRRSIDVQIMDLADEIAYAAHDLEDSLAMGYMSISEILYEFKISEEFKSAYKTLLNIVKAVQKYSGNSPSVKSSEEYSSILRRELTSRIVDKLVRDVGVSNTNSGEELAFKKHRLLSSGLKKTCIPVSASKNKCSAIRKDGRKSHKRVVYSLFRSFL